MEFHEAKAKPLFNLQNNPSANHAIAQERKGWEGGRMEEKRVSVWYISPYFARDWTGREEAHLWDGSKRMMGREETPTRRRWLRRGFFEKLTSSVWVWRSNLHSVGAELSPSSVLMHAKLSWFQLMFELRQISEKLEITQTVPRLSHLKIVLTDLVEVKPCDAS